MAEAIIPRLMAAPIRVDTAAATRAANTAIPEQIIGTGHTNRPMRYERVPIKPATSTALLCGVVA